MTETEEEMIMESGAGVTSTIDIIGLEEGHDQVLVDLTFAGESFCQANGETAEVAELYVTGGQTFFHL